jgi:CO/xanthine dehydrogenase FAD-binding subunit
MGRYERPPKLADALDILDSGQYSILAGGTDFYPARANQAVNEDVLDITAVEGLRGFSEERDAWRIGALTTWSDLLAAKLPPLFDGYKKAAREVGGEQIQNTGTVAGNLCNASPAADGTPNLLALDAVVELSSRFGVRRTSVAQFVLGNRATTRDDNEIVTAIVIPKPQGRTRSTFLKLGARKYLVISIVMVAAVIEEGARSEVASARVAVGSCNAAPLRLERLESALKGAPVNRLAERLKPEYLAALSPISDVRASAVYRGDAALELVGRALAEFARC